MVWRRRLRRGACPHLCRHRVLSDLPVFTAAVFGLDFRRLAYAPRTAQKSDL